MRKNNRKLRIDNNLVKALNLLPTIMRNKEGHFVKFRKIANTRESGIEHIAKTMHSLQVKDIELIPSILLKPLLIIKDPVHNKRMNYYGIKYKANKFYSYIKIVTQIKNFNEEEIVTIYLTDNIKHK